MIINTVRIGQKDFTLKTDFKQRFFLELKPYNIKVSVCCPPDTNTPGFQEEEKTKPEETKLISDSAGLFEPEVVAR